MPRVSVFSKLLYRLLCAAGKPVGGVRPRRLYDILGRRAFPNPEFVWFRNKYGAELRLSHSFHIDRNILNFGCYDAELHLALEQRVRPGMVCFDVGANLGEMSLHMAALTGPGGSVHAFEPAPAVMERLRLHIQHNNAGNIMPHAIALSDRIGEATLLHADPGADNQGLGSLISAQNGVDLTTTVETMTLDHFMNEQKIERLDLMKIDIQGAEPLLLKGARRTLERFSPDLLMEISPADLRAAGSNSRELCKSLEALGYGIFTLKSGRMGKRLAAENINPDFYATNVLCRKS